MDIAVGEEITVSYQKDGYYYEGDCLCADCTGELPTKLQPPEASRKRRLEMETATREIQEGKRKKTRRGGASSKQSRKKNQTEDQVSLIPLCENIELIRASVD